jgi:hypothetical protein
MKELEKDKSKEDSTDLKMSYKSSKVTLTPVVAKKAPNAVANDSSMNPLEG